MRHSNILKYGKWLVGVAAAGSCAVAFSNTTSASEWTPNRPSNVYEAPKWDFNWDKREALIAKCGKKPTATRHLILIRHGIYNQRGNDSSQLKPEEMTLTPVGEEQARLTGMRLRESGIKFDSLISSDMIRAVQTAEIILKEMCQEGLVVEDKDPLLSEGAPCLAEPVGTWHPDFSYSEDGSRIEAAFRKYFHRAHPDQEQSSVEIIVCHANVIRYFVCRALQLPGEAWRRLYLDHCSITVISIAPSGKVYLRKYGDAGHLPITTNILRNPPKSSK